MSHVILGDGRRQPVALTILLDVGQNGSKSIRTRINSEGGIFCGPS